MRSLILITLVFITCQSKSKITFFAVNENKIQRFQNSMTVTEFIDQSRSLKCDGYNIVANTTEKLESKNFNIIVKTICKFSNQLQFIHSDGIELPIYSCNGYRSYGINLCDDQDSIYNLIEEFYLNPIKRTDYPSNPKNATVKFVVDGNSTLESIEPTITHVKLLRDRIGSEYLTKQPFVIHIQSIENDTLLNRAPEF